MKCVKMHKMGWFGVVRGHPSTSAMSAFDRAHMISCSSLIETMHLSCTVFEMRRVIRRNSPPAFAAPDVGGPVQISKRFLVSGN